MCIFQHNCACFSAWGVVALALHFRQSEVPDTWPGTSIWEEHHGNNKLMTATIIIIIIIISINWILEKNKCTISTVGERKWVHRMYMNVRICLPGIYKSVPIVTSQEITIFGGNQIQRHLRTCVWVMCWERTEALKHAQTNVSTCLSTSPSPFFPLVVMCWECTEALNHAQTNQCFNMFINITITVFSLGFSPAVRLITGKADCRHFAAQTDVFF